MRSFRTVLVLLFISLIAFEVSAQQAKLSKQTIMHRMQVIQKHRSGSFSEHFNITQKSPYHHSSTITTAMLGSISGTVMGLDSKAISTAYVEAFCADSSGGNYSKGLVFVAPDGFYQIDSLAAGNYYVFAWADGYVLKYYNNVLDMTEATQVAAKAGEITARIDFNMEKIIPGTGIISGKIWQEQDQQPIGQAQVSAFSVDNPYLYAWTETAKDGCYRLTDLKSGKYYVSVWADSYLSEYYDNAILFEDATAVEVAEPNETSNINFALTRGGIISGTVTTNDGKPLEGVYLEAMIAYIDSAVFDSTKLDPVWFSSRGKAISDENGKYQISGLPSGNFLVRAEAWGKWSNIVEWYDNAISLTDAKKISVQVGMEVTGIDFQLYIVVFSGTIKGRVTDLQGEPIANVYVQAQSVNTDAMRPMIWAYATSDSNGYYQIKELPDDSYYVSAWTQSGWQYVQRWWPNAETMDSAQVVIVSGGVTSGSIDFLLPLVRGTAVIAGYAKSTDGRYLPGANIYLSPSPQSPKEIFGLYAHGFTDSMGYYQIENLPAGSYIASCFLWQNDRFGEQWFNLADSLAAATPIPLTDYEKRTDINFTLTLRPMFGSIAGTIIDTATGSPISRAYIQITAQNQDWKMNFRPYYNWSYYVVSDENGKYQIDGLWEGEYLVVVYTDGAFEYYENASIAELATPIKVRGGEVADVNFAMLPHNDGSGMITGKVMSEWEQTPFEIAVVTAKSASTILSYPQSDQFYTAVTQKDGSYELKGLPPGEYYVMSFVAFALPEFYKDVYDPALATLVKVDGMNPTTGIDFSLSYMLWLKNREPWMNDGTGAMIIGLVTDTNNQPLAGANVYLLNQAGEPIASAQTNATGNYELAGMPLGNYTLQVTKLGYNTMYNGNVQSFSQVIPVQVGNGITEVNFTLSVQTSMDVTDSDDPKIPRSIILYDNYPNPFNPETRISFALPKPLHVRLRIYNIFGEQVAQLVDGLLTAGGHSVTWNSASPVGQPVSSGIYFYRLETGMGSLTGKMILLR
jgi:protocatechuate 3,4-dioxygenase beta subunit